MKNFMKRMIRLSLLLCICIGATGCQKYNTPKYRERRADEDADRMTKVLKNNFSYKLILNDDGGFGNDRSKIFEFSLKKPQTLKHFKKMDQEGKEDYNGLIDGFEFPKNFHKKQYKSELSKLFKAKDCKYYFIKGRFKKNEEHADEMYIYAQSLNKGYYYLFII